MIRPPRWRCGSLCTGYGGLDLAVGRVFDIEHAWHAEIDPDASRVLAAHWPDMPNHGDLRATDWASVEPVDILTAGFPCQPVSAAGRRQGLNDERWLFDDIADAVGRMVTRPRLLVLENVPGLLTANRGHAMARVVHRLAALGYVGRYRTVRASDVGAPHRRERVFIVARPADTSGVGHRHAWPASVGGLAAAAVEGGAGVGVVTLLPTPAARLGERWGQPNAETAHRRMYDEGRRNLDDAVAVLPTPTVADSRDSRNATVGRGANASDNWSPGWSLSDVAYTDRWSEYAPAIARWEDITGRPAPTPTEPGSKGQPRLSPRFVEWLMGLPAGWVTDLILPMTDPRPNKLSRNAALRVLGNGVVPQQATYALGLLGGVS